MDEHFVLEAYQRGRAEAGVSPEQAYREFEGFLQSLEDEAWERGYESGYESGDESGDESS